VRKAVRYVAAAEVERVIVCWIEPNPTVHEASPSTRKTEDWRPLCGSGPLDLGFGAKVRPVVCYEGTARLITCLRCKDIPA